MKETETEFCVKCGVRVLSTGGECPLCGLASLLPARKEWDADRFDRGDVREEDGYESSDYVDGWNDALDAAERALESTLRRDDATPPGGVTE